MSMKRYDTRKPFDLDSEAVAYFLIDLLNSDFSRIPSLSKCFAKTTDQLIEGGKAKVAEIEWACEETIKGAKLISWDTKTNGTLKCYFVFPKNSIIVNRLGTILAQKAILDFGNDIAVIGRNFVQNVRRSVQLRGSRGKIHLGKIAMNFGGGGHPGDASCYIPTQICNKWMSSPNHFDSKNPFDFKSIAYSSVNDKNK